MAGRGASRGGAGGAGGSGGASGAAQPAARVGVGSSGGGAGGDGDTDGTRSSWLYSADELRAASPSRKDGVKMEQETLYREAGMQFIRQAGERLFTGAAKTAAPETSTKARTPHPCTFSAWLYFLRFYARRSFKKFERFVSARHATMPLA